MAKDPNKDKSRTLLYRRVDWFDGSNHNMARLLKSAHNDLNTTALRTFGYIDGQIQGLRIESRKAGLFCCVAYSIPHQPTSLVPHPSRAKAKDTSQQSPPREHDFSEGEIFFLVSGNHIILCPSGVHENVAENYIKYVFNKVGKDHLNTQFSIEKVAKASKIGLLHQEGVKKILLNSTMYEATMQYEKRETTRKTLLNAVAEEFFALFGTDDDQELRDIHNKENLSIKLEISFDARKKGGEIGRKRIEKAAANVVNEHEDDGFIIETGSGKKITADEIRISKKEKLPPFGNSVSREEAWSALEGYLYELKQSGMLEQ